MTTMTVRELIRRLIELDMDEPVYIGLGPNLQPSGSAQVCRVNQHGPSSGITCGYGVYLIPFEHLADKDAA